MKIRLKILNILVFLSIIFGNNGLTHYFKLVFLKKFINTE